MVPAFCPNPSCPRHHQDHANTEYRWWKRNGFHPTLVVGWVQRFRCKSCGRTFSSRTFDLDYYTKKSIPYKEIFHRVASAESVSAVARNLGCSVGSAQNRMDRLARNCIALHESLLRGHVLSEHLVADGFESFDRSQYFPNNINILVGKRSQFLYASTHVTIRRKGRMTTSQKTRRAALESAWKPPRAGIEKSFAALLSVVPRLWDRTRLPTLVLDTDEHRSYPRAIARVDALASALGAGSFEHRTWSSRIPRTTMNPLFPVNYFDRELRKDLAAYHRESACFPRNVANARLRCALYQAWHNYLKPVRVAYTRERLPVHAVEAGLDSGRIEEGLGRLFGERAFLSRSSLSDEGRRVWLRLSPTPLKSRTERLPKYQAAEHKAA